MAGDTESIKGLKATSTDNPMPTKQMRLQVAVVLELGKAHDGSGNGASPDKDKEAPSPISLVAHRNQGDRRVRTGNVPVDGGMIPLCAVAPSICSRQKWHGKPLRRCTTSAYRTGRG